MRRSAIMTPNITIMTEIATIKMVLDGFLGESISGLELDIMYGLVPGLT